MYLSCGRFNLCCLGKHEVPSFINVEFENFLLSPTPDLVYRNNESDANCYHYCMRLFF